MVHVNIELPDDLHKRLKLAAVLEESTIKELVIKLLEQSVEGK